MVSTRLNFKYTNIYIPIGIIDNIEPVMILTDGTKLYYFNGEAMKREEVLTPKKPLKRAAKQTNVETSSRSKQTESDDEEDFVVPDASSTQSDEEYSNGSGHEEDNASDDDNRSPVKTRMQTLKAKKNNQSASKSH
jgi:hypothetical protein